ncbi:MAG TPA: hypothetical protein VGJ92_03650 [Methanocella sp.]|jgi:spore coat polysaccharide biosynthesis protein SpsF
MTTATIVFRCDASPDIGLGHLIRCMAVAAKLVDRQVVFAMAADASGKTVTDAGYRLLLKHDAEDEGMFLRRVKTELSPAAIVLDRKYDYSSGFVGELKKGCRVVIFDNFCDGLESCDAAVFPNAHLDTPLLSRHLASGSFGKVKWGFDYVILRDAIVRLKGLRRPGNKPPRLVITMGGSDPAGMTLKIMEMLKDRELNAHITVLTGDSFKHRSSLAALAGSLPGNFSIVDYTPKALIDADFAICAFGMSIYEMIYLGIPAVCVSHSTENAHGARILRERYPGIEDIGQIDGVTPEALYYAITEIMNASKTLPAPIDGDGARRAAKAVEGDD